MAITANKALRAKMRRAGVYYWMLAQELGVTENTIIVWLRKELEGNKKKIVTEAVDRLTTENIINEKEKG